MLNKICHGLYFAPSYKDSMFFIVGEKIKEDEGDTVFLRMHTDTLSDLVRFELGYRIGRPKELDFSQLGLERNEFGAYDFRGEKIDEKFLKKTGLDRLVGEGQTIMCLPFIVLRNIAQAEIDRYFLDYARRMNDSCKNPTEKKFLLNLISELEESV